MEKKTPGVTEMRNFTFREKKSKVMDWRESVKGDCSIDKHWHSVDSVSELKVEQETSLVPISISFLVLLS